MPKPKNGETRMAVDVPLKVRGLMDGVNEDTGQALKKLVAWACYRCYRDYGTLTLADIRKWRDDYERWLNGDCPGDTRASPDESKPSGGAADGTEKTSHG